MDNCHYHHDYHTNPANPKDAGEEAAEAAAEETGRPPLRNDRLRQWMHLLYSTSFAEHS